MFSRVLIITLLLTSFSFAQDEEGFQPFVRFGLGSMNLLKESSSLVDINGQNDEVRFGSESRYFLELNLGTKITNDLKVSLSTIYSENQSLKGDYFNAGVEFADDLTVDLTTLSFLVDLEYTFYAVSIFEKNLNFLIGMGAGVAINQLDESILARENLDSSSNLDFAWRLSCGIEYELSANWSFDVKYSYFDFGKAESSNNTFLDGKPDLDINDSYEYSIRGHLISMGFSYYF